MAVEPSRRVVLSSLIGVTGLALAGCEATESSSGSSSSGAPAPGSATAAGASSVSSPRATASTGSGRSVVVVGAGMAGLACARDLMARGFEVTVLEARDRIGGRIHTTANWPDIPIDLGASWIHGTSGNPLTALAKQAGAKTVATSYDSADEHIAKALRSQGLQESDGDRWNDLIDQALAKAAKGSKDVSVTDAVKAVVDRAGLSPAERADLDFTLADRFASEWGVDVERISAQIGEDGEEFDGADVLFPEGYAAVPQHLAKGLTVTTGEVVSAIEYSDGGVSITSTSGRRSAAAVVVTVPLGVLKAGDVAFTPPLPTEAGQAIARIGVGALGKTFFRFDAAHWPRDVDWQAYVGVDTHWCQWLSLAKLDAPVLLGFTVGEHTHAMEKASIEQVTADAMPVLREMFGANLPKPVAVQRSTWSLDQFAKGSYSFPALGSTRDDREALAEPIGRLVFAGEASEPDYYGTVHGAYLSGVRAAGQVADLLKP